MCVIAPFQRPRKRLVMLLPRYTRLLDVIELIVVLSNVAWPMRLAVRSAAVILRERGPYARIACISGTMPIIRMTRLRL